MKSLFDPPCPPAMIDMRTAGVWEYVNPYFAVENGSRSDRVYRAQRVPYDWVPQLTKPTERPVVPPDITTFRVPGTQP